MKLLLFVYPLLIIGLVLAGCETAIPTLQPTSDIQIPSATVISPTITLVPPKTSPTSVLNPTPIPFETTTLINTLEPEIARETIKTLLSEPVDCSAPCFWGILPGQTTINEARYIFSHLGLQMTTISFEGNDFLEIHYDLLSININLTIKNNFVENLRVTIHPEQQKSGIKREWSAYSPETLIMRYGKPSHVDFIADWSPGPFFTMQMYFDAVDLIVEYDGQDVIPQEKGTSQVCLLTAQFDSVSLWMGKNPAHPPVKGIPLEKVTSLSIEEFSKLMTGDPKQACFNFNGNVFQ